VSLLNVSHCYATVNSDFVILITAFFVPTFMLMKSRQWNKRAPLRSCSTFVLPTNTSLRVWRQVYVWLLARLGDATPYLSF